MDIIGSLSKSIGLVKKAKELADAMSNLELKAVIVELQGQLLDVKEECLTYREELQNLRAENERLSSPAEVEVKDGLYYKKDGGDGPFCIGCYDTQGKMIRLAATGREEQRFEHMHWRCPACKATYR